MKWSELKSWQKGFVIASITHVIYFIFLLSLSLSDFVGQGESNSAGWIYGFTEIFPATIILFPLIIFIEPLERALADSVIGFILTGIVVTLLWGLFGALIGFIVGKIKGE